MYKYKKELMPQLFYYPNLKLILKVPNKYLVDLMPLSRVLRVLAHSHPPQKVMRLVFLYCILSSKYFDLCIATTLQMLCSCRNEVTSVNSLCSHSPD